MTVEAIQEIALGQVDRSFDPVPGNILLHGDIAGGLRCAGLLRPSRQAVIHSLADRSTQPLREAPRAGIRVVGGPAESCPQGRLPIPEAGRTVPGRPQGFPRKVRPRVDRVPWRAAAEGCLACLDYFLVLVIVLPWIFR